MPDSQTGWNSNIELLRRNFQLRLANNRIDSGIDERRQYDRSGDSNVVFELR